MQVIHIGMGKTGTSSLQSHVFPRLVEDGVIGAYNPPALCHGLDGAVNGYVAEGDVLPLARAAAAGDMLLSNETLIEWDPALWEPAADRLWRIFGPDAVIVITLRAPADYLRSLYQQVVHAGKVRPPEAFFLPRDEYRALRRFLRPGELDAIDIDAFDLAQMVAHYVARFDRVLVVPFEAVGSLRFLSALWPDFASQRASFAARFAEAPRANASYSALAMRLTLARERSLARIGLRSRSASDRQRDKALAHVRAEDGATGAAPLPSWHRIMSLVSRYGPRAGYALPEEVPLGARHAANVAFYARVCDAAAGGAVWLHRGTPLADALPDRGAAPPPESAPQARPDGTALPLAPWWPAAVSEEASRVCQ